MHDGRDKKALEIAMRDALAGLEELSTEAAYRSTPGSFDILSIEPPEQATGRATGAVVHLLPARRSNDVVSFLMERERRALTLSA